MLSYIALVWNEVDSLQADTATQMMRQFQARSPQWKWVLEAPGLAVACQISAHDRLHEAYALHARQGVILGKLFARGYEAGDMPTQIRFDEQRSAELITSQGKALISAYWGSYVAFLRDPRTHTCWVLRDPSGRVACDHTQVKGIDIYFSQLEDLLRLAPLTLSVDVRGLLAHLTFMVPCMRRTGLAQITQVLAGECIERRATKRTQSFYWNPLKVATTDVVEDPDEAVRLMRSTVRVSVHAWASCFDSVLHSLSGGLDSSIVLACLMDAPGKPRILCENYYCRSQSKQDERRYARLAAARAGCELIETHYKDDLRFQLPQELTPTASPFWLGVIPYAGVSRLSQSGLCPALFTGHGGDELFYNFGCLPTLADYFHRHGLRGGALRVVLEDLHTDRVSLWRVLRKAVPYGLLKRPWNYYANYLQPQMRERLGDELVPERLREQALEDYELAHPLYLQDSPAVPPGKIYHAALLSLAANKRQPPQGTSNAAFKVDPLYSQPLMELCLRIPLYVLRSGGRDRAIARRAFIRELPPEIAQRRSKGGGNEEIQAALARNIHTVRQVLLNGQLVQQGFLDREKLQEALSLNVPTRMRVPPTRVLNHFSTELWYRHWAGTAHRAVA